MKSTLIKDTTKEERIALIRKWLPDDEKLIAEQIGDDRVLRSLIKVASHKEENGYYFNPETTLGIIFGELAAPFDSERVQAIESLFADTGIHFRSTEFIREESLESQPLIMNTPII